MDNLPLLKVVVTWLLAGFQPSFIWRERTSPRFDLMESHMRRFSLSIAAAFLAVGPAVAVEYCNKIRDAEIRAKCLECVSTIWEGYRVRCEIDSMKEETNKLTRRYWEREQKASCETLRILTRRGGCDAGCQETLRSCASDGY